MKIQDGPVTDLMSVSKGNHHGVGDRISRRIEILEQWLTNGVPRDKEVPRSLRFARTWSDAELGIKPIKSPNDFTTTNPIYGTEVKQVSNLLEELRRKSPKLPKSRKRKMQTSEEIFDRSKFDSQIQAAISQWHTEREMRLREKMRADSVEARSVVLTEEIKKKDQIIADLRSQLASLKGLQVMK